jgi:Protein of unknown function (DUF3433)
MSASLKEYSPYSVSPLTPDFTGSNQTPPSNDHVETQLPAPPPFQVERQAVAVHDSIESKEVAPIRHGSNGDARWSRERLQRSLKSKEGGQQETTDFCSDKNWKSVTLRYPVLVPFIAVSLALVTFLETLYHYSSRNGNANGGGLAFAASIDELSGLVTFSYLYFPTVLAVMYSMVWNYIDLDAKRLEPWFQLSCPRGATAEDSLLLHYPFEFLAFVPFRALRRKYVSERF